MNVLQICSYFLGSKVHSNLFRHLDSFGVRQTVFCCTRSGTDGGNNLFDSVNAQFVIRRTLKGYHRILYHHKVNKTYAELKKTLQPQEYDIVQAASLFADGVVAYKMFKEYGTPYVVAIRNTDINEFLAVAPHTWALGVKTLLNATRIVFISKAPMDKFCRHFLIKRLLPAIKGKFILQPNGIDDFWMDNIWQGDKNMSHNIIYVGKFDTNKNVLRLIDAVLSLTRNYPDIHLHLVGGDGWQERRILKKVDQNKKYLTYHGKIFDKPTLLKLYRQNSIFAMPSIHETFGLVYIEALTQGLAVLYTQDQGIDGLLDGRVGERVSALSQESIENALNLMMQKRNDYQTHEVVDFEQFRWKTIGEHYMTIYKSIKNGNNQSIV